MSVSDSTVLFRALPTHLKVEKADKHALSIFAVNLSESVAGRRSFTCLVTSDRALRKLNRHFLGHDYATDVLSFPSGLDDALGDLAISIERAEQQAQEFGHSRFDEIRILMLHGLLHLTGLDHETDSGQMSRAERKWRKRFSLPCSLIARNRRAS